MSEWVTILLGNLTVLLKDGTHGSFSDIEEGVPLLSAKDIEKGKVQIPNDSRKISNDAYKSIHSTYELEENDVLLTIVGTIGRTALYPKISNKVTFQRSVAIIRTDYHKLLPLYCFHYFNTFEFQQNLVAFKNASAQGGVYLGSLKKIPLYIPTVLSEQCKIARILSTVDAVIEKTEAAIAKYKAIKAGMMHDLFTRGIDLSTSKLRPSYEEAPELYKQSELGWVPKGWEVDSLENSNLYVDYRGKTPPKSEFGIFLVTARNIKDGYIDYEISKEYIPEYAFESAMSRGKVRINDVVITTEAPMGNVAQIDRNGIALAQRVIKYRGKSDKLLNDYLAYYLMSDKFQRRLIAESTGSTVLGIKGSRLHKLLIYLPPKKEQMAISKRIKTQERLLRIEGNNFQKQIQLKQALMSDLLTGKVRVKYEEDSVEEVV